MSARGHAGTGARGQGRQRDRAKVQIDLRPVQRCKRGNKLRVAGGSPGWQVAGRELSEGLLDLDGGGFGFRAFLGGKFFDHILDGLPEAVVIDIG